MAEARRGEGRIGEGQALHAGLLAALLLATGLAARAAGPLAGTGWLVAGIVIAVLHQEWVWLWWRLEYWRGVPSRRLGDAAFPVYAAGFAALGVSRILSVIAAGYADRGSLGLDASWAWALGALLLLPVVWLVYSIARFFGFAHAMGADHFFEEHRTRGLCREGIFRYIPNAMYTVGFLALWSPAVALSSRTALLLAAFNHAYIWVHYFCTERPDMRRIYG